MKYNLSLVVVLLISFNFSSYGQQNTNKLELATFGNGCFWCTEAIFQRLEGVESLTSGFSGGNIKNPAYREVVSGRSGHAEVIQIKFDPNKISFIELLEVFFATHDPTTLNRQGYDVGTQYRSAVFYHSQEQKDAAELMVSALSDAEVFDDPIVTEVTEFDAFYPADDYHQNYYNQNKNQPYCQAVINPKLDKFLKVYQDKLKKGL
jgi:peptide-methionine (S)-S-oxide reductase